MSKINSENVSLVKVSKTFDTLNDNIKIETYNNSETLINFNEKNSHNVDNTEFQMFDEDDIFGLNKLQTSTREIDFTQEEYSNSFSED